MSEYSQVPLVDALLIPVLKALRDHAGGGDFLVALHFGEQKAELLSKLVERLEPVAAAVLVSVAGEEALE